MNKIFLLFLLVTSFCFSQNMTTERLNLLITEQADSVAVSGNSWNFMYKGKLLICIADTNANRMRIISPIAPQEELSKELILNSLVANFHTALDVKYAISDNVLWSVFTHPLKELSTHQVKDAISQVYFANATFGSLYSSTNLNFPGSKRPKEEQKPKKERELIKEI